MESKNKVIKADLMAFQKDLIKEIEKAEKEASEYEELSYEEKQKMYAMFAIKNNCKQKDEDDE